MLLFVFPVVKEEWLASKYNFTQIVCFFSMGVIMAALCAMSFAGRPNIAKFINVHSYLTITRRCGFYGDPNFYTAQITAALGGALMDLLQEKKKGQTVFQFVLIVLLVYCGFLSGSKSFVLTTMCMLVIWSIALFRMRGRIGFKLITIFAALLVVVFIATSVMFRDLIDVLQTRFSFSNNLSDFTTGRTELWKNYAVELLTDWKTLFLGKGFTNIKVGGKSSHNTILQMVYQFGLIGFVPLLAWSVCFFLDAPSKMGPRKRQFLSVLLLVTGAFLPWLAIDALFFDEFFLLQMYVYMGCRYLGVHAASADETTKIAAPETEDGK